MSSPNVMIIGLLSLSALATNALAKPICDIEFVSPAQIEKILVDDKKLVADNKDKQYVSYFDKAASVAWAFATEQNSSHPAVVCRKIVIEDGTYHIKMDVRCGGPKQSCDKMVADFEDLNKRTVETLN